MFIIIDKSQPRRNSIARLIPLKEIDIFDIVDTQHLTSLNIQMASFVIITDKETQKFRVIKDRKTGRDFIDDLSNLGKFIEDRTTWFYPPTLIDDE